VSSRTFCDSCGVEANLTAKSLSVEKKLGLDVVLTFDGRPTGDRHVCAECMAKLVFNSLPGFFATSQVWREELVLRQQAKERDTAHKLREEQTERCVELEKMLKRSETMGAVLKGDNESLNARIGALTAQMHQIQVEADKRVKRAEHEAQEARSDDPEAKEYRRAAARREAKRAGATS
jgi:hypothetical protein